MMQEGARAAAEDSAVGTEDIVCVVQGWAASVTRMLESEAQKLNRWRRTSIAGSWVRERGARVSDAIRRNRAGLKGRNDPSVVRFWDRRVRKTELPKRSRSSC
jgi:ATP-dependent Clp protease ATP-binding subunit ClpA